MSQEKVSQTSEEGVHSANSWETADLGDEERRKKFLRLMGAAKKEHHGKFVIGDKEQSPAHARSKDDTEHINKELEEQYQHSYEHRITRKHHTGLGFSDAPPEGAASEKTDDKPAEADTPTEAEEKTEDNDTPKEADTTEVPEAEKDSSPVKTDRKRESTDAENPSEAKKPKMTMNFVKSSDS